ncbi:hypothetical protein B7H23_14695 [Notoacmeibacter marinus]|uniref:Glycerate kinase n=1 Tax=Notoacmeibacter marinus TaxID=1876515 RepID=A0A231UVP9_9HYPH|nr:DUF4147 domain-containing protein [Notoacmeibacter marinus]OXS99405.1 hypothetical protein B7H23_14695 [Notoacmeibacter marinus]
MVKRTVEELRQEAADLFHVAIDAADPGPATARALLNRSEVIEAAKSVTLLAFGKGAVAMARAALPIVGEKLRYGVVVTTEMAAEPVENLEVIAGGHPVPNEGSLVGGEALARAATQAGGGDLVLALISGGGSALAVAPIDGLDLSDKIALNRALLRSGADIIEMNALRSAASRLKGGGLAYLAAPASVLGLILSDVPGDDPAVVASGPTAPGAANPSALTKAIERVGAAGFSPEKLKPIAATRAEPPTPGDVINRIVGSNSISLDAVAAFAEKMGWKTVILDRWLEGDVADAAERFHAAAQDCVRSDAPVAILAGGETSVTVTGEGRGGRNQELALRLARICHERPFKRDWCFLSGGTDGRDGPTDAAGGLVDAGSWQRIIDAGVMPDALLANNDSNKALAASGDLLTTGPTGTNVADIQILLLR